VILDHLLRFFGVAEELLLLGWLDSWFESEQVGEVAARRPIHIQHLETSEEQVVKQEVQEVVLVFLPELAVQHRRMELVAEHFALGIPLLHLQTHHQQAYLR
jgi:hypothetical protein